MERDFGDVVAEGNNERFYGNNTWNETATFFERAIKKAMQEVQVMSQEAVQGTTTKTSSTTRSWTDSTTELAAAITTTMTELEADIQEPKGEEELNPLFVAGAVLGIIGGTIAVLGTAFKCMRMYKF